MDLPHVMVVEDAPRVLKLMVTILRDRYRVTSVADGAKALSLIGAEPIDVVLTDVRMPGASGFDVLRAVQRAAPRTPVVIMTAYANVPDAVAAMRLGAFDYVAKPLDADEIALVVARALEHLRGVVEHPPTSAALPPRDRLALDDALRDVSRGFHLAVEEARRRVSTEYLETLMRRFRGNVTQAAAQAGMTRESLHRTLKQYAIQPERFRARGGDPEHDASTRGTG